jgi:hypothetical protein
VPGRMAASFRASSAFRRVVCRLTLTGAFTQLSSIEWRNKRAPE